MLIEKRETSLILELNIWNVNYSISVVHNLGPTKPFFNDVFHKNQSLTSWGIWWQARLERVNSLI